MLKWIATINNYHGRKKNVGAADGRLHNAWGCFKYIYLTFFAFPLMHCGRLVSRARSRRVSSFTDPAYISLIVPTYEKLNEWSERWSSGRYDLRANICARTAMQTTSVRTYTLALLYRDVCARVYATRVRRVPRRWSMCTKRRARRCAPSKNLADEIFLA